MRIPVLGLLKEITRSGRLLLPIVLCVAGAASSVSAADSTDYVATDDAAAPRTHASPGQANAAQSSCFVVEGIPDLAGAPPTLTLHGQFCPTPTVLFGKPDGTLDTLTVISSNATDIVLDLTGHTSPATYVTLVTCPNGSCELDVAIGSGGAQGPAGPA